jgi:hypothetical protein
MRPAGPGSNFALGDAAWFSRLIYRTGGGKEEEMKAILLLTASGALLVLTSYGSVENAQLVEKLKIKGITKFVAFDVPLELARQRYGAHFQIVSHDLRETDDLRVLDFDGQRIFRLFAFTELGPAILHEGRATA